MADLIWIFVASCVAFTLSAATGGGASMVLVPLLGFYLPPTAIPFALTLASAASSMSRLVVLRRHIAWGMVARFVPASLPGAFLGVYLLSFLNPSYVQLLIGVLLVANLPMLLRAPKHLVIKSASTTGTTTIGFAAGFVSGLTGAVGLLFNRFYLTSGLTPNQIVATRAANEVLLHLVKLGLYVLVGIYVGAAGQMGLSLALGACLAGFAAKPLLARLDATLFRKMGYGIMVLSGVVMLGGGVQDVARLRGVELAVAASPRQVHTRLAWGRGQQVALEFELGDGLQYERQIPIAQAPADVRRQMLRLLKPGQTYVVEEVYAIGSHGFELYVYEGGTIVQHEFEDEKAT